MELLKNNTNRYVLYCNSATVGALWLDRLIASSVVVDSLVDGGGSRLVWARSIRRHYSSPRAANSQGHVTVSLAIWGKDVAVGVEGQSMVNQPAKVKVDEIVEH